MKKTIQVQARLPAELVEAIDEMAKDEVRSRAQQIEFLLLKVVEQIKEKEV